MSRLFNATATDGQYTNLNGTITATALGLTMPGKSINYVCATVTNGAGLWRIISSQSNQIFRQGFTSQVGFVDPERCMIPALAIQPDMIFQIFSLPLADPTNTNSVALVTSNRGVEAFFKTAVVDATATEMVSVISGLGVGDLLFGANIQRVCVQLEGGASLTSVTFIDASGGTTYTGLGGTRLPDAGGWSTMKNASFPLAIMVQKGWKMNETTISG